MKVKPQRCARERYFSSVEENILHRREHDLASIPCQEGGRTNRKMPGDLERCVDKVSRLTTS